LTAEAAQGSLALQPIGINLRNWTEEISFSM
jgi:hypothetical protein